MFPHGHVPTRVDPDSEQCWVQETTDVMKLLFHSKAMLMKVIAAVVWAPPVDLRTCHALHDRLVFDTHESAAPAAPFLAIVVHVRTANGVVALGMLATRKELHQVEMASFNLLVAREARACLKRLVLGVCEKFACDLGCFFQLGLKVIG